LDFLFWGRGTYYWIIDINVFVYYVSCCTTNCGVFDNRFPPFLFERRLSWLEFVDGHFALSTMDAVVAALHVHEGGVITMPRGFVGAGLARVCVVSAKSVAPTIEQATGCEGGTIFLVDSMVWWGRGCNGCGSIGKPCILARHGAAAFFVGAIEIRL